MGASVEEDAQMTEAEKLREAQDFITRALQKQSVDRIDALHWEQTPQDLTTKIQRLVLLRSGEKYIFTFTEYELFEDYGSKEWEKQLRNHVGEILMEF